LILDALSTIINDQLARQHRLSTNPHKSFDGLDLILSCMHIFIPEARGVSFDRQEISQRLLFAIFLYSFHSDDSAISDHQEVIVSKQSIVICQSELPIFFTD
jgi:hypothetical protein